MFRHEHPPRRGSRPTRPSCASLPADSRLEFEEPFEVLCQGGYKFQFWFCEAKLFDAPQVEGHKLVCIWNRVVEEEEHVGHVFAFSSGLAHYESDFVIHVWVAVCEVPEE